MSLLSSRFILGTASLGSRLSFQKSKELIQSAYELGFRSFDTAVVYGSYQAHDILKASLKSVTDVQIYSKFLSSNYDLWRDLVKLIICRCGPQSYFNFMDVMRLHKRSGQGGFCLEDIDRWVDRQELRYSGLRITGWLAHSPSATLLSSLQDIKAFPRYGLSARVDDISADIVTDVLQTDADSYLSYHPKPIRASKIQIHQVHSCAKQAGIETSTLIQRLLESDSRLSIIVGTTKVSRLTEISKLISNMDA